MLLTPLQAPDRLFLDKPSQSTQKGIPVEFVVIGQNHWGRGKTVDEAKKNFKAQSRSVRLGNGYTLLEFSEETEFVGVDDFGRVHYKGPEPKATEFPPKK